MLPQVDAQGRIYGVNLGTPVSWNAGIGYSAAGQVCGTTVQSASDTYLGGLRLDAVGRVVTGAQSGPLVYAHGGWPINATTGSTAARQIDTVPAATDPYVAGVRIGPTGGLYVTSAVPP